MATKINKVKTCLADIATQVNNYYSDVNFGGCARYAVELANRLDAMGITDYKLRVYGHENTDVSKTETILRNGNANNTPPRENFVWFINNVTFAHVRLQWRGKLWDVKGAETMQAGKNWNGHKLQDGSISLEAMTALLPMQSNWNRRFNRKKVPVIRKIMDRNFNVIAI